MKNSRSASYFLILICSSILFQLFSSTQANAQWMLIDKDGGSPDASAALEVADTSRGFLAPRLTTAQMDSIANPAEGLLVYNTNDSVFKYYNGANWLSIGLAIDSSRIADNDGSTKVKAENDESISFSTNGNEVMRLDSAGNLGIGTTTPSAKLEIIEDGLTDDIGLLIAKASQPGRRALVLQSQSNRDIGFTFKNQGIETWFVANDGGGGVGGDRFIIVDSSGQVPFNIEQSGNIGLGVTAPKTKLHLSGTTADNALTLQSLSTSFATKLIFEKANDGETTAGNHNFGGIYARAFTGSKYQPAAAIIFSGDGVPANNDIPGKITFSTTANGDSLSTERMVINNAGNVGIRTNTPDSTLSVAGGINAESIRLSTGASNGSVLTSDANGTATWQDLPTDTHTIFFHVSNINGNATTGTFSSLGGGKPYIALADSATEHVRISFPIPAQYSGSTMSLKIYYTSTVTTGNFWLSVATNTLAIGDDLTTGPTGSGDALPPPTTANTLLLHTKTLNVANSGDYVFINFERRGALGVDSSTGEMRVFAVAVDFVK